MVRRGDQGHPPCEGRHSCGVVAKDTTVRPRRGDRNWKSPSWTASSSPGIDRQRCLTGVLQARSDLTVEMGAPTHDRGVWPKVKDRRHLVQRHAERETREKEPPLETVKTLHRRQDWSLQIRTVPGTMEAELEGLQSQVAARKGGEHTKKER